MSKIQKDQLNYSNLFADVSKAIGLVHGSKAKLKQITQKNPDKYIMKSSNLPRMLRNLRKSGKITFLLTNSGFEYTDSVLVYLLGKEYKQYFDYIVVDARKPLFFTQSTAFREVLSDGALSFTTIGSHLDKNKIYSYGNLQEFTEMIHIRAKEILYCGDHITGDTGATKNELQRTLYICPEIKKEIAVMSNIPDLYRYLSKLERTRG